MGDERSELLETKSGRRVWLVRALHHRWIIVHELEFDKAWCGWKWVPHRKGQPFGRVQICNFDTKEEAQRYVRRMK